MKKNLLLMFFALLFVTGSFAQNNFFVSQTTGSDTNDGKTWKTAFQTIAGAIKKAYGSDDNIIGPGDYLVNHTLGVAEINLYVAEGNYDTETVTLDQRVMVHIYGGFPIPTASTVGLDLCSSVPSLHKTAITGSERGSNFILTSQYGGITFDGLYIEDIEGAAGQGALLSVGSLGTTAEYKTVALTNTIIQRYKSHPTGVLYCRRFNDLKVTLDNVVVKAGDYMFQAGGAFLTSANGTVRKKLQVEIRNTVFNNIRLKGARGVVFFIEVDGDKDEASSVLLEKSDFCSNRSVGSESVNFPTVLFTNGVKDVTVRENHFTRCTATENAVGDILGVHQFEARDNIYQGNLGTDYCGVWGFHNHRGGLGGGTDWEKEPNAKVTFIHDRFYRNYAGDKNDPNDGEGGALHYMYDVPLKIDSCEFVENETATNRGGALVLESSALTTITNSTFCRNVAGAYGGTGAEGGAINCDGYDGDLTIINCSFIGNSAAEEGGAIYHSKSDLTLTKCLFEDNYTIESLGGEDGGAISMWTEASAYIDSCVFIGNLAPVDDGGAISLINGNKLVVTNSIFDNNHSRDGGAVITYNTRDNVRFENNIFRNNSATGEAGAVKCRKSPKMYFAYNEYDNNSAGGIAGAVLAYVPALYYSHYISDNEVFKHNEGNLGGAVYIGDNEMEVDIKGAKYYKNTAAKGGAIYSATNNKRPASIINSEFLNNKATDDGAGGAMYIFHSGAIGEEWKEIDNCTFVGNTANQSATAIGADIGHSNNAHINYVTDNALQNEPNSTNYPGVNNLSGNTTGGTLTEPAFQLEYFNLANEVPECIAEIPEGVCVEGDETLLPDAEVTSNPNSSNHSYIAACENTTDAAVTFRSPTGYAPFTFTYDRTETLDGVSHGSGTQSGLTITTLTPATERVMQIDSIYTVDGYVADTTYVQAPRTDVEIDTLTMPGYTITRGYDFVSITAPASAKGTLFTYVAKQVEDSYFNDLTGKIDHHAVGFTCSSSPKAEIFFKDCTDSDADGYADTEDLDDDNDGILDSKECAPLTSAAVDSIYRDGNVKRITPSDLGISADGTGNIPDKDISDKFGYPAGSGAVVVSVANYKVLGGKWTTVSGQKAVWTVKGGMARYVVTDYSTTIPAHSGIQIDILDGTKVEASPSNPVSTPGQFLVIDDPDNPYSKYFANVSNNPIIGKTFRYISMAEGDRYFKFSLEISESSGANVSATYQVGVELDCDEDGDGIPNRLDLDSDRDFCPDAIEGNGSITNENLNPNGSIDVGDVAPYAVDVNGVPTIVGGTGQAVGNSQDSSKNDCSCGFIRSNRNVTRQIGK